LFDKKRQIIPYILTACFHVTVPDSKPSWQQPMLLHLLWTVSLSAGHRVGAARTAVCRVGTSAPPAWLLHGWPTAGLCPSTDTASNVLQEPWFGHTLKSYTHLLVGVHYLLVEQPAIHNVFFFPHSVCWILMGSLNLKIYVSVMRILFWYCLQVPFYFFLFALSWTNSKMPTLLFSCSNIRVSFSPIKSPLAFSILLSGIFP